MSYYADILRKMVQISSFSHEEEAVRNLLSAELTALGVPHELVRNNIVAMNKHFSPHKKTLALDAHIDTVPPNNGYTRNPYDSSNDPEIVYGLGSNDDGASVVAMIATFCHFYDKSLPFNLLLTLTCEEECSGPNGANFLYSEGGYLYEKGWNPMWAIVGEPTQMKVATSERGLLVIDAQAEGVSGHAARGEGINALYKALDDIATLRQHRFEKVSPTMGEVRLQVTQIEAGTAHNVVPDRCRFVIDVRPTEQYRNEDILHELQQLCQSKLKARNLRNKSSATPRTSALYKTVSALGWETYSSPTTSNWIRIGCEAVKMGPGDSARSHRPDEYVLTTEITDAIEKYIHFIQKFHEYTLE